MILFFKFRRSNVITFLESCGQFWYTINVPETLLVEIRRQTFIFLVQITCHFRKKCFMKMQNQVNNTRIRTDVNEILKFWNIEILPPNFGSTSTAIFKWYQHHEREWAVSRRSPIAWSSKQPNFGVLPRASCFLRGDSVQKTGMIISASTTSMRMDKRVPSWHVVLWHRHERSIPQFTPQFNSTNQYRRLFRTNLSKPQVRQQRTMGNCLQPGGKDGNLAMVYSASTRRKHVLLIVPNYSFC